MNLIKRSILYIIRNSKKLISLFMILLILGNVLCMVSSLNITSSYISDTIKSKIGAIVIYKDKRYNNIQLSYEDDSILDYEKVLSALINHDSVKYGNYSYMTYLEDEYEYLRYGYGISSSPMVDVKENKIQIIEGREISQDEIENGDYVVLVSEGTMINNHKIQLNDEIPMSIQHYETECDINGNCNKQITFKEDYLLKVVGIFKKVDKVLETNNQEFDIISNRFYIPNKTLLEIFDRKRELIDKHGVFDILHLAIDEPFIRLKNSDDLEIFKSDAYPLLLNESDEQDARYDYLYTSDDEYLSIAKPIQILRNFGNVLLIGSIALFSILIAVLLVSIIKERIYEIGILLSMGERKYKIVLQLFLELLVITSISITLSLLSGNILGDFITNKLITIDMLNDLEVGKIVIDYFELYKTIYISTLITILLSLIYPSYLVIKQNPKEILLK